MTKSNDSDPWLASSNEGTTKDEESPEAELARAGFYVLLYLLDAALCGSQQTIFSDNIQKLASKEVAAAKLFSGHLGSLLLGGVD